MKFSSSLNLIDFDTTIVLEKRMKLLESIDELGSISRAAKEVPLSYKAAWDAVDLMNNLCPVNLVEKETGGKRGGGARLTEYGKNLLKTYKLIQAEHEKFLSHLTSITDFNTGTLKSIKRVAMQISARNQIRGVIREIKKSNVSSFVLLELKNKQFLQSVITKNASINLDLKVGDDVVAIFKSSSVLLSTDENLNLGIENKLRGKVENITKSDVNSEVVVDIGGDLIVCVITTEAVKSLKIRKNSKVEVIVKSSEIMIGK